MSKNKVSENLITDLSDRQLDELLAYVPAFSEASLDNIEARALGMINETSKKKLSVKKVVLTFLAAVLLLALSSAVLAAVTDLDFGLDLGQVFNSFFRNPAAANVIDVRKTVEANGITITVLQAFTDGNKVYATLELRDLYGGRLSDYMDFTFDMNTLAHGVTPMIYNEANGAFLVGININRHLSPVEVGDYLSFSLESFLLSWEWIPPTLIDFPLWLHAVERDMIPDEEWKSEAARRHRPDGIFHGSHGQFLKLGELHEYLPGIDWVVLTNVGLYRDYLHVQTRRTNAWNANSRNVFLVDRYGNSVWHSYGIAIDDYREDVFYIGGMEDLSELSFAFGGGAVVAEVLYGPWDFYFPITARAERKIITARLYDSLHFARVNVEISPMITSIHLLPRVIPVLPPCRFLQEKRDYVDSFDTPFITLTDGSKVELFMRDSMFSSSTGGSFLFTSLYFNVSHVHSITILGTEHLMSGE